MKPIAAVAVLLVLAACGREGSQVGNLEAAVVRAKGQLGDSTVVVRRLSVESGRMAIEEDAEATPSGLMIVGLSAATGNLSVLEMATGQRRLLTTRADWQRAPFIQAIGHAVSPDGRTVAFTWQTGETAGAYELRVVGIDGSGEGTVLRPPVDYAEPTDWTPDGQSVIALMYAQDQTVRLALVSPVNGAIRVVRSFDWRSPGRVRASPDGAWLAYDIQLDQKRPARELVVIRMKDGREERITNDSGPKYLVGWSPNGAGLFYRTNTLDATTIWYVPVRDGRPLGSPRVIRADISSATGFRLAGGVLLYSVSDEQRAFHTISVDIASGRALAPPNQIVAGNSLRGQAIWSPDGRQLAFIRATDALTQEGTLAIRDLSSGEERTIPLPQLQGNYPLKWMPDGSSIIVLGSQRGQYGAYGVRLTTGEISRVSILPSGPLGFDLAPDGRTDYVAINDGSAGRVLARDVAAKSERELWRGGIATTPTISPDGNLLAFVAKPDSGKGGTSLRLNVVVVPISGGAPRILYSGAFPDSASDVVGQGLTWTADGKHLVFLVTGGDGVGLLTATLADGSVRRLGPMTKDEDDMVLPRISPDGKRVVYRTRVGGATRELWVMENLPGSRAKAAAIPR